MLVLTLMIMGVATFLIGLLPTYEQIGPWAAVALVLLRIAQGFGVGGEWGGAVLMAVEHAPPGKRGFYGSWPQIGVPAGLLLSTAVFPLFSRLPDEQFLAWGWRVPFLLSVVLVVVGLVIRVRILETPAFARSRRRRTEARQPIVEVLRTYPQQVLLAMGARFAENGAFYIYSAFVLDYATQQAEDRPQQIVLNGDPARRRAASWWRFRSSARCRIGSAGARSICSARSSRPCLAYPLFWLLDTGSPPLVWLALIVAFVLLARGDVRAAGGVPVRAVRHARALQRRVAGRPAGVGVRRRSGAVHRHRSSSTATAAARWRST